MARAVVPPLTDAEYKKINDLLKRCANYKRELETAKAAKQPMDEYLKLAEDVCDELQSIKSAYFPDRP
jgi:chaperonin cofactor prefoldin